MIEWDRLASIKIVSYSFIEVTYTYTIARDINNPQGDEDFDPNKWHISGTFVIDLILSQNIYDRKVPLYHLFLTYIYSVQ